MLQLAVFIDVPVSFSYVRFQARKDGSPRRALLISIFPVHGTIASRFCADEWGRDAGDKFAM